jgi:hypothetical protein
MPCQTAARQRARGLHGCGPDGTASEGGVGASLSVGTPGNRGLRRARSCMCQPWGTELRRDLQLPDSGYARARARSKCMDDSGHLRPTTERALQSVERRETLGPGEKRDGHVPQADGSAMGRADPARDARHRVPRHHHVQALHLRLSPPPQGTPTTGTAWQDLRSRDEAEPGDPSARAGHQDQAARDEHTAPVAHTSCPSPLASRPRSTHGRGSPASRCPWQTPASSG